MSEYNCNVLNCGNGKCVHKTLQDKCPLCGMSMVEVTTTGHRFCSNPNTEWGCDYEDESCVKKPKKRLLKMNTIQELSNLSAVHCLDIFKHFTSEKILMQPACIREAWENGRDLDERQKYMDKRDGVST